MKIFRLIFAFSIIIFLLNSVVLADDENEEFSDKLSSILEVYSDVCEVPSINSRTAIIYDRTSGFTLYGKKENTPVKMASTTKIMTAIIAIENSNLEDIVTVSQKAAGTGGSRLGLKTNDKISVCDLLYGLMLCSGNDAAVAIAEYISGSIENFAILMNKKCETLNLTSTHFVTPHGLDNEEHYTTAYELAIITNYALQNDTFKRYVGTKNYTISINGYYKNLSNTNELLGNLDGVYGVKTGFTNGANRCLVTAIKRGDMDLICVVLGADTKKDRTQDSIKLIEYAFKNFEMVNIKEKIISEFNNWKLCNISSFKINKGVTNSVDVILKNLPYDFIPVNCNYINNISIYIYCNLNFDAPLCANTAIGYLTVSINDKNVLSLDIYNSNYIPQKNWQNFFYDIFTNYITHLETLLYKKV